MRHMSLLILIVAAVFVDVVVCREYGLELELLTITLNDGAKSVDTATTPEQFELEVEKRNSNEVQQILGNVALLAVRGRSELVFPEVSTKNPFRINRLETGETVCFRLQRNFDALLEDCRPIIDHATTYYSSEMYNKTLADGSQLLYKFSQYLLKEDEFSLSADSLQFPFFQSSSSSLPTSTPTPTYVETNPPSTVVPLVVCDKCTVPIVFASLEGGILLLLIIIGTYYFFCVYYQGRKSAQRSSPQRRQPRPTITVIRPGSDIGTPTVNDGTIYDDSGVSSSASSHLDNNSNTVDIRPHDTYEYDTNSDMNGRPKFPENMKTIDKLKASTLSVSTAVNSKLSEATVTMKNTLMTTGQSLAQLKEKMNTKTRSKQDTTPPLPPPKDYPSEIKPSNENYESQFEDDEDEVYDVIELDEVDETNVTLPRVPTNKPVRSYLHTTNVSVADASDARNKSKKFSYG